MHSATVNHEMRTPINSIIMWSDLLLNTMHDSKHLHIFRTIKSLGQLTLNHVNDNLDHAQIMQGIFKIRPQNVALGIMFEEVRAILDRTAQKQNTVIEYSLANEFSYLKVVSDY